MLIPKNSLSTNDVAVSQNLTNEQIRCINDLLRNAHSRGLNYSERGFRQKLIDLCFKLGYYRHNKTIFLNEE